MPTPIVAAAGTEMTGAPVREIATSVGPAEPPEPPRLSVALITSVSLPVLESSSVSVAKVAFTAAKEPLIVKVVLSGSPTLAPPSLVADRRPWVSVSDTLKVSPVKAPASTSETPVIAVAWPCDTEALVGAVMLNGALTVSAIFCCTALWPFPSVAFSVMVSLGVVPSVSFKLANVASTSARSPWKVIDVALFVVTTALPEAVTFKMPCVSATVTVNCSEPVAPASVRLSPVIESATLCRACAVSGAVMTGGPWPLLAPIRYSTP